MDEKELIRLFKKAMEESYKILLERLHRRTILKWVWIFCVLFPALLYILDYLKSVL